MKARFITAVLSSLLLLLGGAGAMADGHGAVEVNAATFSCIRDMTPVRGFYVDNIAGDLEGTLAVANSNEGGTYPPGSVVQLVPGEAMVKHAVGSSPATNDWEFFELDTSAAGTEIRKRGYVDVVNRFGGNCLACHAQAEAKWDMICETGHGCDPIPITREMTLVLQKADPRCEDKPSLTPEEMSILQALQQALQAQN